MRLFIVLLLAGCAPFAAMLDPPLAQLARWDSASPAQIAAEPAACPTGHAACARLHGRRAEACMDLAMAARAPGAACPAVPDHLPCAAQGYAAARALTPNPVMAGNEAQARLCLAAFLRPADAAREAAAAIAADPAPLVVARAALIAARPGAGTNSQRCEAARQGQRLAPPGSREASDLALRRAGIPDCGATP